MTTVLALVATLALVLMNAFFVASEFAMVKIRPTRLEALARKGNKRAAAALGVTNKLDAYLSANQLGITLASLALGWIGEPAFASIVEPLVHGLGRWGATFAHGFGVAVSFTLITFLHVVLGELAPKSLAIQKTEIVALWTAAPLRIFYLAAYPIIWFLNAASGLALRVLGLHTASEAEMVHSPEEMRMVLQHVAISPGARRLIDRMFDYTRRVARHVMTLRRDIVVIRVDATFEAAMNIAFTNQYSRYPLVDGDSGVAVGYVHIKDIAKACTTEPRPTHVRTLMRTPLFVPDATPLDDLRREFLRTRIHLAVIQVEGTPFAGVVTLEDLLEEFVGEIQDEQDAGEVPPIVRKPDGTFELDGRVTLDVAAREIGLSLDDVPRDIETLGGYLRVRLPGPARVGDVVSAGAFELEVLEVRDRRVRRAKVTHVGPDPELPDAAKG
jgi:CBS domain containing-hemolysin-like protein